jgi:hypothetical protein
MNIIVRNIILISILSTINFGLQAGNPDPLIMKKEHHLSGEVFQSGQASVGSQYFYEEWLEGDVLLKSGQLVERKMLRYNGLLDELIWMPAPTRSQVRVDKNMVAQFSFTLPGERETVVFENITIRTRFQSSGINIFAQVLYKGDISLYSYRKIKKEDDLARRTDRGVYHIPVLEPDPIYYIVFQDHEALELRKLNNRSLLRLFPEHKREIREILRGNEIRMRSEKDAVQAVKAIGGLIE